MHRKFLLVIVSTLLTLLVLESIFRIFDIQPFQDGGDPAWRMVGDLTSLGIRDHYSSRDKADGIWRMLVLGDSVTYGAGVEKDQAFPKVMERTLRTTYSPDIEVWNCSAPGWDTENELNFLKTNGLSFQPDMFLICFFLNDATFYGGLFPELRKVRQKNAIEKLSFLYHWVSKRIMIIKISKKACKAYNDSFFQVKSGVSRWENCKRALLEFKAISDDKSIPMALTIFPCLVSLNDGYPFRNIHTEILDFCASNSIDAFDLLPAFDGLKDHELRIRLDDDHPNAKGHIIAAEGILRWLYDSGHLPTRQK